MQLSNNVPKLSKRAFWSGEIPTEASLFNDWKKGIVINVFENGTLDDMLQLMVYYGRNEVITILKNAMPIKRATLNLCCAIFNLKQEDFKCYTENRFRPF